MRFPFIAASGEQDRFREQQDAFNRVRDIGPKTINLHISSKKTAGERSDLLREFVNHKRSLMTNARCLTEGVDVPATDCVLFADPKQSRIDIVQAAGRALRRYPGKEYGYILLPLIVPSKMEFSKFAETTAFRQVASTITALSIQDERIAEEFRAIEKGQVSSGKIVEIEGDVPVGMKIKLGDFAEAISTRLWQSVGRANWRPFDNSRAFARTLDLKSFGEWRKYCKSGKKPPDIPAKPSRTYASDGWTSWGDWLGTGIVSVKYRRYQPFIRARAFARRLKFNSESQWRAYVQSGKKPDDVPARPDYIYGDAGWKSMGDWLGTGVVAAQRRKYRSFKQARAFARGLKLKSGAEWVAYCQTGRKPDDIPTNAYQTYKGSGWKSMGDWLGTGTVAARLRQYRPFKQARAFARGLKLNSQTEWFAYCKSGKKPDDVPAEPRQTYADKGWIGFGDWLGTGRVANHQRKYRPFKQARAFARSLRLNSRAEWSAYCQSGKTPDDVPGHPERIYIDAGWISMGDWLGTSTVAARLRTFRPFRKARAFARTLRLNSRAEWSAYCQSGKKPDDIPSAPHHTYAESGWSGMSDSLGYASPPGG